MLKIKPMAARTESRGSGSDMQIDSDVEMGDEPEQIDGDGEVEVDIDGEDEDDEEEDEEDEDADVEVEQSGADDDDEDEDEAEPSHQSAPPRLRITLKLPTNNAGPSSHSASGTPDEMDFVSYKRTPLRRAKTKVIQDVDVESEDPTTPSESELDESALPSASARSVSGPSGRPMTTRQAVLASVVDASHVSLNEGSRSKKAPLNETELALRREETARKRKNLTEKRLEDEKAETINRLLKKQSRPRNKRTNTTDAAVAKPKAKAKEDGDDEEGDEEEEEVIEVPEPVEEVKPVMYRWISTIREPSFTRSPSEARTGGDGTESKGKEKETQSVPKVRIVFGVPEIALGQPVGPPAATLAKPSAQTSTRTSSDAGEPMDEDSEATRARKEKEEEVRRKVELEALRLRERQEAEERVEAEKIRPARAPGVCAVEGCGLPRKYRVPKDWTVGACGMAHLKDVSSRF